MQIQKPPQKTPQTPTPRGPVPASLPPPPSPFSQLIIWTALPAGYKLVNGKQFLRLHVHVAPRLQIASRNQPNTGVLQSFPEFANWPGNFGPNGLSFSVEFRNSPSNVPVYVAPNLRPTTLPDAALWQYLVPSSMTVISYVPDVIPNVPLPPIHGVPTNQIYRVIRQVYTGIAIDTPTHHPTAQRFLDPQKGFGSIAMLPPTTPPKGPLNAAAQARFVATQKNHAQLFSQFGLIPSNVVDPAMAFHQLNLYNKPSSQRLAVNRPTPNPNPQPAGTVVMSQALSQLKGSMDFHKLVSFLASYPLLQQRMGFVLELLVPLSPGVPQSGSVQVVPQWKPVTRTTSVTPQTYYDLTSTGFIAHPRPANSNGIQNGVLQSAMLNMQNQAMQMFEIDVAQAGINIQNALGNLLMQEAPGQGKTPGIPPSTDSPLPTLRSAGLSLHFTGRTDYYKWKYFWIQGMEQALQANGNLPTPLFADDVLRGYRVDIQDLTNGNSNPWHSLCDRSGSYVFAAVPNSMPALRNWNNVVDEGFIQLSTSKAADGSIPDLNLTERIFRWIGWSLALPRPGKTVNTDDTLTDVNFNPNDPAANPYGIGVKFAPLANSLPRLRFGHTYHMRARAVDLAGYSLGGNEVTEPSAVAQVSGPATYFRFEPIDAPVVALTGPLQKEETAHRLIIRSNYKQTVQQYVSGHPGLTVSSDRHIAPPVTTPQLAELLGMFDAMQPAASWALIDSRRKMPPHDTGQNGSNNMIDTGKLMNISYLPDPLSRGPAFLVGAPNSPTQLIPLTTKTIGPPNGAAPFAIDFYPGTSPNSPGSALGPAWAGAVPLRLRIVDPAAMSNPTWDANARVLSVPVPQGQTLTLRLSSYLTPQDLDKLMGIWDWVKSQYQGSTGPLQQLTAAALQGLQWMLTPYQELTLVHAVQQPLVIPDVSQLSPMRGANENGVGLLTSKTLVGGFNETVASVLGKIPVDGHSTAKTDIYADWQDPVDDITDPTVQNPNTPFPKMVNGSSHAEVKLEGSETVIEFTDDASQIAPQSRGSTLKMILHEFHDTKYHAVHYRAVASSRYADYFPGIQGPFIQTSPPVPPVDVLSTARPAAPKVAYVVPSFDWQKSGSGSNTTSKRMTGLRVYLERPWFSSGAGELLGVVLWPNPSCPPPPPNPNPPPPPLPKPGQGGTGGTGNTTGTSGGGVTPFAKQAPAPNVQKYKFVAAPPLHTINMRPQNQGGGGLPKPTPVHVPLNVPTILAPYVTQWGLDPLWLSNPVTDLPGLGDFKNAVATGTCLTVEGLAGVNANGQPIPSAWGPDAFYDDNLRVCVAGFQPAFDRERNLWFCDIAIDPQSSYFPFVRLALTRFQPHSLQGQYVLSDMGSGLFWSSLADVYLSHIVQVDFAQIAPNRTLSVASVPGSTALSISLAGITYAASSAVFNAQTSSVEVSLETQPNGSSDDAGWTPVASSQQVLKLTQNPPNANWQGQVNLPAARGSQQFRLVIKEFERVMGDANSDIPIRRLVYADAIKL